MERIHEIYRPAEERLRDFREVERAFSVTELRSQAERCMACGIPFCHGSGCPLGNVIPGINAAVAAGEWKHAWELLSSTSNFPEFTSHICPALCEGSCTGGLNGEPVMVRQLEKAVVETAFRNGWVEPAAAAPRNGRKVAVIGSGPSGLAAADELSRRGFSVTVYEAFTKPGGLLRYGIPDFKLEKRLLDRRIELLRRAGVEFCCGTRIGEDVSGAWLARRFDEIVVAIGTPCPRNLPVEGRELEGVHFALEFLRGQNRVNGGELDAVPVSAAGRRVVVIGGGDTGSDCVGTSLRQGARSVVQIELMPKPPEERSASTPWPAWPYLLRTSSSHKEGGERRWCVATKRFLDDGAGRVAALEAAEVEWEFSPLGKPLKFKEKPGSIHRIEADLVLLAMGFTGVGADGNLVRELGLSVDARGRLQSAPERHIHVVGDAANGASLVVRAIADGRKLGRSLR